MAVPLNQAIRVGAYVVQQHLLGRKRYPLVLMLEPLFRCNLACAGCGKIDYPAEILNQRLSVAGLPRGGRRVRRAGRGDRRRRAAAAQGNAGDRREASWRAASSSISAPTRCCWRRNSTDYKPHREFRLGRPSRRRPRDARPLGQPGGRVRPRGGGDQQGQGGGLPRLHQHHAVRRRQARAGREVPRRRDGDGRRRGDDLAGLRL